jgi:hypothetical protein
VEQSPLVRLSVLVHAHDRVDHLTGKIEHVKAYLRRGGHGGHGVAGVGRYLTGRDRHVGPAMIPAPPWTIGVPGRHDRSRPLEFWGDLLHVKDVNDVVVQGHMDELAQAPPGMAYEVRHWLAGADDGAGGIYVGRGAGHQVAGVVPEGDPRGWGAQTFNAVDGLYSPVDRRLGLGHNATTDRRPAADRVFALHELGHVLDDALGNVSTTPDVLAILTRMQDGRALSPYFTAEGNRSGYASELFAEMFRGWALGRFQKLSDDEVNRLIRLKIGAGLRSVGEVKEMIDWFDRREKEMARTYSAQQDAFERAAARAKERAAARAKEAGNG